MINQRIALLCLVLLGVASANTIVDEKMWSTPASSFGGITASVSDANSLYTVSTQNHSVTKLDLVTGKHMWTQQLFAVPAHPFASIVDAGSALVVLLGEHQLFGICRESGSTLWANTAYAQANIPTPILSVVSPQKGLFSAMWELGLHNREQNTTLMPEMQVFNASTGKMLWRQLGDNNATGVLYNNVNFVFGHYATNGAVFRVHLDVIPSNLFAPMFTVLYMLDVASGRPLYFANDTTRTFSNFDDGMHYFAGLASPNGTIPTNYFGTEQVVNIYNAQTSQLQWVAKFNVTPANSLDFDNTALIVTEDILYIAYYPMNNAQKWLAAFDVSSGGAPLWNVSLPHVVNKVQTKFTMYDDEYIVLAVNGNRQNPAQFLSFNVKTGEQGWNITAPTTAQMQLVFRQTPSGAHGVVIPNKMGWSSWEIGLHNMTAWTQYSTVSVLAGVETLLPAPGSANGLYDATSDFIVVSPDGVARYTPTPSFDYHKK